MTEQNYPDQTLFDAAAYWANKPIKKFVVCLVSRLNDDNEQRIFAASCSDRAAELALQNSDLANPAVKEIRLATPLDLGCEIAVIRTPQPQTQNDKPDQLKLLATALADCLAQMQACGQHHAQPKLWPNPVGTEEWDVAVAVAALAIKEIV